MLINRDRDGAPVGDEMTLLAAEQEEREQADKTDELEGESGADEDEDDDEDEEDEGRTVKITATIVIGKHVVVGDLQEIIFTDILGADEDVKEIVSFEWEDVK